MRGHQGGNDRNAGNQGGMWGIWVVMQGIGVGMRGNGCRDEGNQGENLCIEVELMN